MSRSYKKNPILTDRPNGAKFWKRQSNRKIRHYSGELNNRYYHRLYNSYNIHDYKTRWSENDAKREWTSIKYYRNKYISLEDFINHFWKKYFYRK